MSSKPPILVIIDPTSEIQPALEKASVMAAYVKAPLELFICTHDEYISGDRAFGNKYLSELREVELEKHIEFLMNLAEPLRAQGQEVSCKAVWDNPIHEAVVREALSSEPRMVVKDTHHHGGISRALFTHTDWQLIRACPCPLWLVKPTPAAGTHQTILAAVDPLHEHDKPAALDRKILDEARELSVTFGGNVHVAHVCDTGAPLPVDKIQSPALIDTILRSVRDAHEEAFFKFTGNIDIPEECVHWRYGSPKKVLPELAQEISARIVVLGAVSRSRLKHAIIGSTSESVLDRLPCDAVVVKPDDFECPIELTEEHIHLEKTDIARHAAA